MTAAATSLRIDRLTLHAGQLGESDARRLAALVSRGLASLPVTGHVDHVEATVETGERQPIDELAAAVAIAIEAAILDAGVR
ncbi:hypothetical protein FK531_14320 [Rhodococcus spelaei]|uniref:Uncharacterized protein n=1 Tax=Rhodococcus spelaei TaxID=2546320 RepID=A0A541B7H9_9NOCA|nr:hypothetical protein [Rhodococcus spelaei]TQF68279.1 hypothetical protein FK531_14320 [Rhodococcus spelaei]